MKFLSADSKLMQSFRLLFDYMGSNIMFILCSLPVITIASAQTAHYTAIRAIQRGEPWLRLFLVTFGKSLKRPTVVWVICLPIGYLFTCVIYFLTQTEIPGSTPALVCACITLGLLMCITAVSPLLYSRFEFTVKELFRNSIVMLLANPIQVILGTALIWLPVAIFVFIPWLFLDVFFWLAIVYFSIAEVAFARLMRYPLGRLADEIPEKADSYLIREAKKRAGKA